MCIPFLPQYISLQISIISPKKQPECPGLSKPVIAIAVHMMFTLRWLLFLQFRVKI